MLGCAWLVASCCYVLHVAMAWLAPALHFVHPSQVNGFMRDHGGASAQTVVSEKAQAGHFFNEATSSTLATFVDDL